ncbi:MULTISPECIES: hypothetical protein [unclassified Moorena]|nr:MULTISPECIES: hypothetical protein [unclassified Moorena]
MVNINKYYLSRHLPHLQYIPKLPLFPYSLLPAPYSLTKAL